MRWSFVVSFFLLAACARAQEPTAFGTFPSASSEVDSTLIKALTIHDLSPLVIPLPDPDWVTKPEPQNSGKQICATHDGVNHCWAPLQVGSWVSPREWLPTELYNTMPANTVWANSVEDGFSVLRVVPINSCGYCGKPMTFRQAAFDKKMSSMWIAELGLTVADTEITEAILKNNPGLREGNPFLGGSREVQYGIRIPIILGAWAATAYLRAGNVKWHRGGVRRWWVLPILYQAASAAGIIANEVRFH